MSSNTPTPGRIAADREQFPPRSRTDGGSLSTTAPRPSIPQPGSFSVDLRSATALRPNETVRPEFASFSTQKSVFADVQDGATLSEQRVADFREKIQREIKIRTGTENLLEALHAKGAKHTRDYRMMAENELQYTNRKIAQLTRDLDAELVKSKEAPAAPPGQSRLSQLFKSTRTKSPTQYDESAEDFSTDDEEESESPTYVLSNLLQELEVPGMPPAYYVERGNGLVELLNKHQTLKYDLVWSIFGLRIQALLLSDNREVAASGYRVLRYAIKDQKSLSTIRALHTDYLVILSLIKDSKASVEREQALKLVRAFLDVEGGVKEVPKSVVRVIVAIAEHEDDRMRNLCILTLAEMLVKDPELVVQAGGIGPLTQILASGQYRPAESLGRAFLYLLDTPLTRKYMKSGHEIDGGLAAFTNGSVDISEEGLKSSAKVIAALLKCWAGLTVLSANNFSSVRSLMASLCIPSSTTRDIILELLLDVLRIKTPSWSSSFLAGRRLTTYGRVTNLKADAKNEAAPPEREELVEHYVAVLLAVFLKAGLVESLLFTIREEQEPAVKRKATLLLGEVLNMASNSLPTDWTADLQVLPSLFQSASMLQTEQRHIASAAIYQIDSVNRTLYRTAAKTHLRVASYLDASSVPSSRRMTDPGESAVSVNIEESAFRVVLLDSQVLNTVNFSKWKWDLIEKIIDGPLQNPKRLDEAMKATKFIKRLLGFYRPFKYRFSEVANTKHNQLYVRVGCSLLKMLLQHPEGVKYLAENKLLRQIAECLAQVDRLSGITASAPLFAADRLTETLAGGYFAFLGAFSSDPRGLLMLERWKVFNMFYHIVELQDRDDLIKALLVNLDYSLNSHLRIILSKALTTCSKPIRIISTRLLRKYATMPWMPQSAASGEGLSHPPEWAVDYLITQLYDPDIEVCETAIKILEHACNDAACLEFIVRRQPALDHLGEIGAPLLLKFLSTSNGYKYLDGLDYITQEMEDWFLGRNDSYVMLVEAALTRAMWTPREKAGQTDDSQDLHFGGVAPPHFYRELTRTAEGCNLLVHEGHFAEFVSFIDSWGLESTDNETLTKVKGALWAIGNIGSMKLGASFLESTDVVQMIIKIAESSEVMSMRGTATYALGLISKSVYGQEILAEHGWDAAVNDVGESTGVCLPLDLGKLFAMPSSPGEPAQTAIKSTNFEPRDDVFEDEDETFVRILTLVNDLNNTVLAKKRAAELHNIKAKSGGPFQSSRLFMKVMDLLERHHFKLPSLRFVIDLFDKQVMRRVVYDEEDDDDDEYDTTLMAGE